MFRQISAFLKQVQPTRRPLTYAARADWHRERAAIHLYLSVRPAGGLYWRELTSGQRRQYRDFVTLAWQMTNLTNVEQRYGSR